MFGYAPKVLVCCQNGVAVLAASSGNQEVGWAGQHAFRSASRSEPGCSDVGRTIHAQERERFEELHKAIKLLYRPQSIEQFLEDVAEKEQPVVCFDVGTKGLYMRIRVVDSRSPEHQ